MLAFLYSNFKMFLCLVTTIVSGHCGQGGVERMPRKSNKSVATVHRAPPTALLRGLAAFPEHAERPG